MKPKPSDDNEPTYLFPRLLGTTIFGLLCVYFLIGAYANLGDRGAGTLIGLLLVLAFVSFWIAIGCWIREVGVCVMYALLQLLRWLLY